MPALLDSSRPCASSISAALTRRRFLIAGSGAAALTLAGCGDRTPAGATVDESSRTVTTPLGTYEIPASPSRVFAVDSRVDLETALALGFEVVATTLREPAPWVPAPAGIEILDGPVVIEQVLALDPDLIICSGEDDGQYWPTRKLLDLAPVLPTAFDTPWKDDLNKVADWAGRRGVVDELLAEYERLVSEARSRYGTLFATKKVVYLQYIPATGTFAVNTEGRLQPQVLADLGGSLLGEQRAYATDQEVSIEQIGQYADADGIFLQNLSPEPTLASMTDLPLWKELPAVRAGRVIESRGNINYGGIYSAQELVRNWSALYATME